MPGSLLSCFAASKTPCTAVGRPVRIWMTSPCRARLLVRRAANAFVGHGVGLRPRQNMHAAGEGTALRPLRKFPDLGSEQEASGKQSGYLCSFRESNPGECPDSALLARSSLCDPMNCSTPGLPVHHQLPEFTQTHVHRVSDAIQPSHPLSSPSPPPPTPSQHQSLFQ